MKRFNLIFFLAMALIFWAGSPDARADKNRNILESARLAKKEPVTAGKKDTLVIGRVSSNPKKHVVRFKGIASYVQKHLEHLGIKEVKVLMAKDNDQMIRFINEGRIDWITETPFSALYFQEKTGLEPLLRRWKKGVPEYHTVFFVRKDSGISTLADLEGRKIAFNDKGSTTSFYVPYAVLMARGYKMTELSGPRSPAPKEGIGYVFTGGDELNVSSWVYRRMVDVGAFSNIDWDQPDDVPDAYRIDFRIIHREPPIPRALEMVRKNLDPELKEGIKQALLKSGKDPDAAEALMAYEETRKFDEIDKKTAGDLARVRKMLHQVRDRLK